MERPGVSYNLAFLLRILERRIADAVFGKKRLHHEVRGKL
jgi:hypothetical protein